MIGRTDFFQVNLAEMSRLTTVLAQDFRGLGSRGKVTLEETGAGMIHPEDMTLPETEAKGRRVLIGIMETEVMQELAHHIQEAATTTKEGEIAQRMVGILLFKPVENRRWINYDWLIKDHIFE